jgi:hypothetical protein
MKNILLLVKNDSIVKVSTLQSSTYFNNIWLWMSIFEFLIIIFLFYKLKNKKSGLEFNDLPKDKLKTAKSTSIDMDNLMNSINGAGELYKELSKKCHPDRYVNSDKQSLAEEIFQEISKNKRNFKALQDIKVRAINELKIN